MDVIASESSALLDLSMQEPVYPKVPKAIVLSFLDTQVKFPTTFLGFCEGRIASKIFQKDFLIFVLFPSVGQNRVLWYLRRIELHRCYPALLVYLEESHCQKDLLSWSYKIRKVFVPNVEKSTPVVVGYKRKVRLVSSSFVVVAMQLAQSGQRHMQAQHRNKAVTHRVTIDKIWSLCAQT